MINKFSILSIPFALLIAGCHPDDNNPQPVSPKAGSTMIHFDNKVGEADMVMNTKWYKNQNGDSFTVSLFKYYISNIQLMGTDGIVYTEADSYHLINEDEKASQMFTMNDVPAGKYTSITFTIGVDSLHNVSGAQAGALDPINGMFWSWSTGYIMAKFEGNSPKSTQPDNKLMFHIGGFMGKDNVVRTVTLNLPVNMEVNGNTAHLHLKADLLKWFDPNRIDFSVLSVIHMGGADARKVADNYASMFSIDVE